jgi:colanic acid/amylovoran biosynthesis glycosyltransferase
MASRLVDLGCPAEKVKVAFLGIDIERIHRIRETAGVCERESPLILAVGLDREKKGAIYALRAFARIASAHSDATLHFVGDGPYRSVLEKTAREQGIGQRVVFHGYLPVADYLSLLARTTVLVAPSVCAENGDTEGGAPVCAIEAQAMGVPVAGFRHCDMPSVVIDGTTGLLCAEKDVETLASNLDLLIRDDQLRVRMGLSGIQHARKQHDIRNQVVTITELYRQIFEKRPRR